MSYRSSITASESTTRQFAGSGRRRFGNHWWRVRGGHMFYPLTCGGRRVPFPVRVRPLLRFKCSRRYGRARAHTRSGYRRPLSRGADLAHSQHHHTRPIQ
ncbi:unnamed protein product, partial [Iphiclides podalirius]